ncbi:DUF732 domain-containing protein [Mycobacterium sp. SVM_VP21]|nr:DUF732 domain-containing protein [Mycobacterium sp. SVM_VP21]
MAYSAEPAELDAGEQSASWWRPAVLAAGILAAAGALAGGIYFVGQPVAPTAGVGTTSASVAAPPPAPSTVTVTAEAPAPPVITAMPAPPPVTTVAEAKPPVPPEPLPPDALFTQMLARDGVGNSHPSGAIATAKNFCQSMAEGWTANDLVLDMNRAGMPYREAVAFVHDARAVYCPSLGG